MQGGGIQDSLTGPKLDKNLGHKQWSILYDQDTENISVIMHQLKNIHSYETKSKLTTKRQYITYYEPRISESYIINQQVYGAYTVVQIYWARYTSIRT